MKMVPGTLSDYFCKNYLKSTLRNCWIFPSVLFPCFSYQVFVIFVEEQLALIHGEDSGQLILGSEEAGGRHQTRQQDFPAPCEEEEEEDDDKEEEQEEEEEEEDEEEEAMQ